MTQVTLLYFASLRERAGVASEAITTDAPDLAGVYDDVQARHGFTWPREHLRVAVDGEFARWSDAPSAGSEIAFIPPVSGG
ncbi:MoaD/ThiS family protein [Pseudoxanthomonas japonensis]|jgi:molybdopterin synthase sulfur carrier subunit|uniref:MoaD/ThiS family protein n=1 Tax=Pseudoxanthomonas japonensis TaxID=69284 RepID=UPI001BD01DBA|nr:MoaD/ThiS family protein [Pseudoxanthomonas japonensis]NCT71524.1 MoaD/ThiS family protein [Xanthomonadaceae bacterium]